MSSSMIIQRVVRPWHETNDFNILSRYPADNKELDLFVASRKLDPGSYLSTGQAYF